MMRKIIIAPSILAANFLKLESELNAFNKIENMWFHLDIMDAHFVPNLTFGHPIVYQLGKCARHPLDAHLMVDNPTFYINTFVGYNIHNLTFHFESTVHHDSLIHNIKNNYPSVGISLNPCTSVDVLPDYLLTMVDVVLLMSVNPGFGGQKFIPYIYSKVEKLNLRREQLNAKFQIQVDGGIEESQAADLIQRGADNLVAGTYIFSSPPYDARISLLRPNS
ncbi:MAG: ribulose-phosphate 3-epimerase [Oligoflexia bacterium]|nr:ribulose-phosphate 3-epimerase [Oligoflexia bacterium]